MKVGPTTNAIAVDPTTNKIYVANTGNNTVSVIDGNTNNVTNINVGKAPFAISIDEKTKKVYVANRDSNSLSIIDGYSVLNTTQVGKAPIDIAVDNITDSNRSYIYVANAGSQTVSTIDGKTNDVIRTIPLKFSPRSIAMDRQSDMLYINSLDLTAGGILDGRGKDVPAYPKYVQVGNDPQHLAVNPSKNKIYVTNTGSNNVSVIDSKTDKITKVVPLPFYIDESSTLTVYPEKNMIYVVGSLPNQFSVIDGSKDKIVRRSENQGQTNNTNSLIGGPTIVAFNPKNHKIPEMYVVNKYSGTIFFINKTNNFPNGIIAASEVRGSPSDIAFANNLIYIVNKDYNTITVIKPQISAR